MGRQRFGKVLLLTAVFSVALIMTFVLAFTTQAMAAPQDTSTQSVQNFQDSGMQPVYEHHRCERVRHYCHRQCEDHVNYHHCFRHCMRERDCE